MQFQRDKLHNAPPPPAAVRSAFPGKTSPRLLAIAVPFNSQKSGAWLFVHLAVAALQENTAMLEWHGLVMLFAVGSSWALLFVGLVGRALISR